MSASVEQYLESLPAERRDAVVAVRDVVRRHIPDGYVEGIHWNMLCWTIPLERYPDTYNGQPLAFVSLAAQKNYCAIYLMSVYGDPAREAALRDGFAKAGKKLDMGKSCVRFKRADDLALDVIAQAIASTPPDAYIAIYEAARAKARTKAKPRR